MAGWLVVNADDFGVSRGTTLGVVRAHRDGVVTSASLATTTPHYGFAVDQHRQHAPTLGLGLHFTLTSGRPAAPPRDIPLLVDSDGALRWRFVPLLAACIRPARATALLDQIEIELEAQLARLGRDGIQPDHINGERHVHLIPGVFERVAAAALRHGIPFVRVGRDCGARLARLGDVPQLLAGGGLAKSWLLSRLTARARRHLPATLSTPSRVASYLFTGRSDRILPALLAHSPFEGVTEVMVHPATGESPGAGALRNAELERYVASSQRRAELEACIAARGQTAAWRLTTYGQLSRTAR